MPYAEIKGHTCERVVLRGFWRGNQQGCPEEGSPQRPPGWGDGPSLGTVYSYGRPWAHKDVTRYSVSGGKGQIDGTNDSGVAFTISNDATIIYQPGWYSSKAYTSGDGFYNKNGELIFSGHYAIPADNFHSGYLKFITPGGAMTLDGDKGQRSINFSAGSAPSVSATTEKKTVLAQSGSTAMQNFAFEMED